MPETAPDVTNRVSALLRLGFRGRLTAKGLARSLIWSEGHLPPGSPAFSKDLTADLLDYGFGLLRLALRLADLDGEPGLLRMAFERAGETLEAVVRRGRRDRAMGFRTVVAAASYHLARYSARSYALLSSQHATTNLAPSESALSYLMRRDLRRLRSSFSSWLNTDEHNDASIAERLADEEDELSPDDALQVALMSNFLRALALFDYAILTGDERSLAESLARLREGTDAAGDLRLVTQWWVHRLASRLLPDLWQQTLHRLLPNDDGGATDGRWSLLRRVFLAVLQARSVAEIDLWPSQVEAARRAIDSEDDLVVALPTSAGKTRIAELCILRALAGGQRVVYVTPLRALSAQVERVLRRTFRHLGFVVSSLYGAAGVSALDREALRDRNIVVATPEKLDFALRHQPDLVDDVGLLVLDEGHFIGPGEREVRYEVLVQRLLRRHDASQRRIVCLSAVLPPGEALDEFTAWLRQDQPGSAIVSEWRPTRQTFGQIVWLGNRARLDMHVDGEDTFVPRFIESVPARRPRRTPFPRDVQELVLASAWTFSREGQGVLVFCPQRRSVEPLAKVACLAVDQGLLQPLLDDPRKVDKARRIGTEWLGPDHVAVRALQYGVGVHHGQLPRPFLREVEELLAQRVLTVVIASPTIAQGLNLTASVLLVHSLFRGQTPIPGEEFANVVGRAGRAYVDIDARVLFVLYEAGARQRRLRQWHELVEAVKARDIKSGLVALVGLLINSIQRLEGDTPDEVIEYLAGNAAAWTADADAEDHDSERWDQRVASLDSAIMSLIQRLDAEVDDVPQLLDEVLTGSLWSRTLEHHTEASKGNYRALLVGRAKLIWNSSSPAQRKGYFAAGIGLKTGRYLDDHAEVLNDLLQQADANARARLEDQAVQAMSDFADIAFGIAPFKPRRIPERWREVLGRWVGAASMSEIRDLAGDEGAEFVEDALVYRLVWAMEATRARAVSLEEEAAHNMDSSAALSLETGTMDRAATVLLQAGLASRDAAFSALRSCPGDFTDRRGMRDWLWSTDVQRQSRRRDWPTEETVDIWHDFVSNAGDRDGIWSETQRRWAARFISQPPPTRGTPLRIHHDGAARISWVCNREFARLGTLEPALPAEPSGLLWAVAESENEVLLSHIGPEDELHELQPERKR